MVILNNRSISGESFFRPVPKRHFILDPKFVPLDKSIIWHFNYLFWKYLSLWEKTYGERYEASLPSGISESHREEFVLKSAQKFINLLLLLEKENNLPKEIVVLEQGPGTGLYAKKFLDYLKAWSFRNKKAFYKRILYVLQDISEEILRTTVNTLGDHADHVVSYTRIPKELKSKVLFVRHGNLWDQLPCRILKFHKNTVWELLIQACLDTDLEKDLGFIDESLTIKSLLQFLYKKQISRIITAYPKIWKPLIRNIKFKTKWKTLTASQINTLPYCKTLKEFTQEIRGVKEIVFSKGVLDNIVEIISLIDWERGGFIEIVDILVPDITGFYKDRRPKKYDGSIATAVSGSMIKLFLQGYGKHVIFENIRGLNHIVTIRNHSLKELLFEDHFVTIAEIAVMRNQPVDSIYDQAESLYSKRVDIIAFSDQAFAKLHYLTLAEIASSGVFARLPGNAILPILKIRNKTLEEIDAIAHQVKKQNVGNIFLVTGDPEEEVHKVLNTSFSILPKLSKDFFVGTVAHPNKNDIPKMLEKIKKGASFFIMQATYDQNRWEDWLREVKRQRIHKRVPIIAAIIPIISKRTLSVIKGISDIPISSNILKKLESLGDQFIRREGISLAQKLLKTYEDAGIFSGVYIYSKSEEVVLDVLNK